MTTLLVTLTQKIKHRLSRLMKPNFVERKELSASEHLSLVPIKGENVTCERGFIIYHGHHSISIGSNVYLTDALLNAGDEAGSITIDDFVHFGHRVQVLARGHDYQKQGKKRQITIIERPVHIRTGAWIGSGSIILPGTTIGEHSVVGAGSVVTKDVPPHTVVAGNPARVVKKITFSRS